MSVIVKNMEMPKNCKECMFADFEDVDFDYVLYCTANKKYADLDMYDHPMGWNCPLVEIPTSHGRLIDEDTVTAIYFSDADGEHCVCGERLDGLEIEADTVIEAEGREE